MIFEEFRGIKEARAARAVGPSADPEGLRRAYLELLKLALCDLVGSTTESVGKAEDGTVAFRQLAGEQLKLRAAGMDWPLQGLSMVGLGRLDDLQACVDSVVREGVQGDLIEAGSWRGGASMLMRAALDSLGQTERTVWVADSFQGFPQAPGEGEELSEIDFLVAPLDDVKASFARLGLERGVEFVPGFFGQTLPGLVGRRWSLVRLDGDTYDATWLGLSALYPDLSPGGFLIVDDYGAVPECQRAVRDFRAHYGIDEPLQEVDWTCVRWQRTNPEPIHTEVPDPRPAPVTGPPPRPMRVPSEEELALRRELEALRRRPAGAPLEVVRRVLRGRGR
jgi:O-methyltransferase